MLLLNKMVGMLAPACYEISGTNECSSKNVARSLHSITARLRSRAVSYEQLRSLSLTWGVRSNL